MQEARCVMRQIVASGSRHNLDRGVGLWKRISFEAQRHKSKAPPKSITSTGLHSSLVTHYLSRHRFTLGQAFSVLRLVVFQILAALDLAPPPLILGVPLD